MNQSNNELWRELERRPNCGRLHVELTSELEAWMLRTFESEENPVNDRIRRMRYVVLFQTDLVDQIFQNPNGQAFLRVIMCLGETNTEQSELVSRGLGAFLTRIAMGLNKKGSWEESHVLFTWLSALHHNIDYLQNSDLSSQMVQTISKNLYLYRLCLRFARPELLKRVKVMFETITSIALRGAPVRQLFAESFDSIVRFCTSLIEGNLSTQLRSQEHLVFQACITLTSLAALCETPAIVEPAMIYFRWVKTLRYDSDEILGHSISNLSKRVMDQLSTQRCYDTLYSYLSLCAFTASSRVRFIGAIALSVVLEVRSKQKYSFFNHAEDVQNDLNSTFHPPLSNTPASKAYLKQAMDSRLLNDATMLGCHVNHLRERQERISGPDSFLAEAVLRLVGDACPEVRKIGRSVLDRVPNFVMQQAIWCPSLHKSFCDDCKRIVMAMLILSRRGEIPLHMDVLIWSVFPFSCTAVM